MTNTGYRKWGDGSTKDMRFKGIRMSKKMAKYFEEIAVRYRMPLQQVIELALQSQMDQGFDIVVSYKNKQSNS